MGGIGPSSLQRFRTISLPGNSKDINEFVEEERDAGARAREVSKTSKRCGVLDPSEGTWKRRVMDAVSCETTTSDEWDRVREGEREGLSANHVARKVRERLRR